MKFLKTLFSSDYGMLGVLVGLCVFFSFITFEEQQPVGKSGAERLVETIEAEFPDLGSVREEHLRNLSTKGSERTDGRCGQW